MPLKIVFLSLRNWFRLNLIIETLLLLSRKSWRKFSEHISLPKDASHRQHLDEVVRCLEAHAC